MHIAGRRCGEPCEPNDGDGDDQRAPTREQPRFVSTIGDQFLLGKMCSTGSKKRNTGLNPKSTVKKQACHGPMRIRVPVRTPIRTAMRVTIHGYRFGPLPLPCACKARDIVNYKLLTTSCHSSPYMWVYTVRPARERRQTQQFPKLRSLHVSFSSGLLSPLIKVALDPELREGVGHG